MKSFFRFFGLELVDYTAPDHVATAIVNKLSGSTITTPAEITLAQLINRHGLMRIETSDGRQYQVTVKEIDRT